jgi:hypothetical protein
LLFSFSSYFFLSSFLSFLFWYLVYSSLFKHLENVITYKSYKPKCSYIIIVINTKTTYKMRYDLSISPFLVSWWQYKICKRWEYLSRENIRFA